MIASFGMPVFLDDNTDDVMQALSSKENDWAMHKRLNEIQTGGKIVAPFYSLILPVYNVKPYLRRCVQSILQQSYTDYEILLVDDGATDGSGLLCDQLSCEDERIRVIHKENGGLSSARNAGMEAASGEYIWFIDSDDWIEPEALLVLHSKTQGSPDIIKFNYNRVTGKSVPFFSKAIPGDYRQQDKDELLKQALCFTGAFSLSAWSSIYRRSFLLQYKLMFVSERIIGSEDYLFNLQALLCAGFIRVIDQPLYDYEMRDGSLSSKYKPDLYQRFTDLYIRLRTFYADAGALEKYEGMLASFYIWHLLHSGCLPHEYCYAVSHSLEQRRKNVRIILGERTTREAKKVCDLSKLPLKKRVQIQAMSPAFEPLFYWLYVLKKG